MNPSDIPEHVIITDSNGTPETWVDMPELFDAGMNLALKAGTADGDQQKFSEAVAEVLEQWGTDTARYVIVSAFRTFAIDLVPTIARIAKTTAGVDFAAHCEAMLNPGYDPAVVDQGDDDA